MTHVTTRFIRGMLALGLCATAAACGDTSGGDVVKILVPWEKGSPEYDDFNTVIAKFDADNGIRVDIESTRALSQDLDADIAAHDPPDLADLSSPAALAQYRGDGLQPLTVDLAQYYQPWRNLAQLGTGTVYAVPVKADVTSLIWYQTSRFGARPPANLNALEALPVSDRWCLGLASGTASGWPGADWIANILLARQNASTYENWLTGAVPWTSGPVESAWKEWGALMRQGAGIYGGAATALKTPFSKAAHANGACVLERGALAATHVPTTAFDFMRFPSASGENSPLMVAGDFMGLFTGKPNAKKLLAYLASTDAQKLWIKPPSNVLNGYAISADSELTPADYPAGAQQKIAALLRSAGESRTTLCFDIDDMLTPDMSAAFQQAVLDYVGLFDAGNLSTVLAELRHVQGNSRQDDITSLAKDACTSNTTGP